MKTVIEIEIESPDNYDIFPEEGETDDDYVGKEDELRQIRESFAKELHDNVVGQAIVYFKKGEVFDDDVIDGLEEYYIEGWDSIDDYDVKVSTKKKEADEK